MSRRTRPHPPDTSRLDKANLRRLQQLAFRANVHAWLKANGLPPCEFEVRFSERRWRFDLAWVDAKVAVEIHGGVYRQGHHTRGTGFLDDREKVAEAQRQGWRVFECAPTGRHPQTLYSPAMRDWLRALL